MIEVEQVGRSYGDVRAVTSVSFTVKAGEVVGLLGPNGAGKTTILRMLATLLRPDTGKMRVAGYDVVTEPLAVRARIGYETGDTGLYNRLRPREFLRYFGRLHGMAPAELEERIETLVTELDIAPFGDRLCGTLSTGQKQRVRLARAILSDPPVLILDEPTAGLDIVSSGFMLDTLRLAAEAERAVLFSTHIMSEVELLCDRVLLLHEGQLIARGTIAELLAEAGAETLSRAFLTLIERAGAPPSPPIAAEA